ncbi:hypothetical protein HNP84_005933 [Thermocatellispora tengchongensis]|uniref:Uncharacterized protein n=1 Tax=Thermocatellispora tengchongensis TaxID=1073253 RepID=A0A840PB07_9ACTN|nr:hypothetical protein [Thermocatellispora tengchongensis]MBB5136189.1 hypothetical protein [Thermocatellispora tengchongensis]
MTRAGGVIAMVATGLNLVFAATAPTRGAGWSDTHGHGSVTVPADRSMIKVCDGRKDDLAYKAVWHNDNSLDARDSFEVVAPQGGCATDTSLFGSVKVFKLCHGRVGGNRVNWTGCKAAVWPGGR